MSEGHGMRTLVKNSAIPNITNKQGLYPPMISSYNKMQGGNNSFQNPLISKDSDCHEILFYAR